ncbi:MAG TPA: hypothetical protein VNM69_00745 [Bacillus sp. (in: firmicutes)]|uniref:hypothetical protein n=1 Tax=Bacillus litorisediminis TaxID=2922713 RepID=UPI001FAC22FA|nr:hypothetical protein [Bacillus litorisediminis]HWO74423.1 hypothetical protein [Bacillus sp. (in: firmicutes)]
MNIWKWIKRTVFIAIILVASHALYQMQLGAIPCMLLSFYLFRLAWNEFKKGKATSCPQQKEVLESKTESF